MYRSTHFYKQNTVVTSAQTKNRTLLAFQKLPLIYPSSHCSTRAIPSWLPELQTTFAHWHKYTHTAYKVFDLASLTPHCTCQICSYYCKYLLILLFIHSHSYIKLFLWLYHNLLIHFRVRAFKSFPVGVTMDSAYF